MMARRRAFILRYTRLQPLPLVPGLRLHLADEVMPLWRLTEEQWDERDGPLPYWAFAWAGGQALARYLLDHPAEVAGRRVLDVATGSGLCAIAALKAGAASALAADVDAFCAAAVALNAAANGVRVAFTARDLLAAAAPDAAVRAITPPGSGALVLAAPDPDVLAAAAPDADVVLAGDICYEQPLAARMLAWLQAAHARGTRVLIGDPGRTYFPRAGLVRLAEYGVPTTRELEDSTIKRAGVFTFPR